jgi:hypothetical protein
MDHHVRHVLFTRVPGVVAAQLPTGGEGPLFEVDHAFSEVAVESIEAGQPQRATVGKAFRHVEVILSRIAAVMR